MLKRPSTRRRSHTAEIQINLVPMLDALVTMISFLMYTMAFLSLTMIESPLPMVSSEQNEQKLRERPLQLTLTINKDDVLIWSPFDLIPQMIIANRPDGGVDIFKLHESLIGIKQKFAKENNLILVPQKETSYDTIVAILDTTRNFEKSDPIITLPNAKTGVPEPVKLLFGDVVFGNLLGND